MADLSDQIYIPTPEQIRDQFLRDIRLEAIRAGVADPPVEPKTDYWITGTAVANVSTIGLQNIRIAQDNSDVFKASGRRLDDIRVAEGLPEVVPTGAKGKIKPVILGTTTITNGQQFTLDKSGLRGEVVGTYVAPVDGTEIDVKMIDVGKDSNAKGGETVTFAGVIPNVETTATVSKSEPLTGGTEAETDERKRRRIVNKRRNAPAGGNWGHIREVVLNADPSIQDCFVYPAAGWAASAKVVPVRALDPDPDNKIVTRAVTDSQLKTARDAVHKLLPAGMEINVDATEATSVNLSLSVEIPDSAQSGGNGNGWLDAAPWPPLNGADQVTITTWSNNGGQITVDATTTTSPVAGVTHISVWSPADLKFVHSLVTAVSGSSGAWVLTLETPVVTDDGATLSGAYVSPTAKNMDRYGSSIVEVFNSLGPGEITTDTVNRLPRAQRHPLVTSEWPSDLTTLRLTGLSKPSPEITDASVVAITASTPTVPALVSSGPGILEPNNIGIYEQ